MVTKTQLVVTISCTNTNQRKNFTIINKVKGINCMKLTTEWKFWDTKVQKSIAERVEIHKASKSISIDARRTISKKQEVDH